MSELARRARLGLVSALFRLGGLFRRRPEADPMQAEKTAGRIYEFEARSIDGKTRSLSAYKGRPLLIVNTASLCGFTPQYKDLEDLHAAYGPRGLAIAAFPANEFGAQEPGSDSQIHEFCRTKYSVSFDLYAKIAVKGPGIHPLYKYLTEESGHPGEVRWNFEKFLVGPDGTVRARFPSEVSPAAGALKNAVEALL